MRKEKNLYRPRLLFNVRWRKKTKRQYKQNHCRVAQFNDYALNVKEKNNRSTRNLPRWSNGDPLVINCMTIRKRKNRKCWQKEVTPQPHR
jgi:hypothetical protein